MEPKLVKEMLLCAETLKAIKATEAMNAARLLELGAYALENAGQRCELATEQIDAVAARTIDDYIGETLEYCGNDPGTNEMRISTLGVVRGVLNMAAALKKAVEG